MGFPVRGLVGAAIATALVVAGPAARADAVQDLAAAAAKKGPVIWYESSPPEAVLKIAATFNKTYPDIKIQFVRNTGGGGIAARIIQESEAGAATASFFIGDVAQLIPLNQRNLLLTRDWKSLGVDPALSPTPYAVAATAALGVLVWNKQRVADGDLPKTWDEMLAERWRGKIGQWVRAATLGTLAKVYGEQHMRDYVRKLIDLKAMIYPSTFQLAQQVAAGEVDIGMGLLSLGAAGDRLGRAARPALSRSDAGQHALRRRGHQGRQCGGRAGPARLALDARRRQGVRGRDRARQSIDQGNRDGRAARHPQAGGVFVRGGRHHRKTRRRADADADGGGEEALTSVGHPSLLSFAWRSGAHSARLARSAPSPIGRGVG